MLTYENELWATGVEMIAGIDEVGRGCLFGDVVAAAVILPPSLVIEEINDSKKLSEKKREFCYEVIMEQALAIGVGRVNAEMIDQINIKQAARLAMKRAVEHMLIQPQHLLIDAETIDMTYPQLAIIKGDQLSQSIAAASIIAKVTRDRLCLNWDMLYPGYGIAIHKGYATELHRARILELGPTALHRRTFLGNIMNEQLELF
ncbi:MAG: ribonuclease HII [Paenibacillaceae bacterium]